MKLLTPYLKKWLMACHKAFRTTVIYSRSYRLPRLIKTGSLYIAVILKVL